VAERRRAAGQRSTRATTAAKPRRKAAPAARGFAISSETARSLVGVLLLVAGLVTLIALLLPAEGLLNRYVDNVLRPLFGQGALLLPVLLLVAGAFVERAPKVGNGWQVTTLGGVVIFMGALGLIHLASGQRGTDAGLRQGGGVIGNLLASGLSALISPAGAFVVLLGLTVAGLLLLFNLTVRGLLRPVASGGRAIAGAVTVPMRSAPSLSSGTVPVDAPAAPTNGRRARTRPGTSETDEPATGGDEPTLPAPESSPAPLSRTVWLAEQPGPGAVEPSPGIAPGRGGGAAAAGSGAAVTALAEAGDGVASLLAADSTPGRPADRPWTLPSMALLESAKPPAAGRSLDHERNTRIIEEKLRSFQIPAHVTGTNTGPVVTQYEVRPDARVKLSRIEGLADDLAMALAARTIRIEAPIPGRDVVGIEIPNHSSEIVGFRELLDDANVTDAASKLTFALGRDVSGKAYAVDLAKMPHLLIAGATGSGKSVCVNALITSLLMRATPAEVRLILVDLKRVELAPYANLPHLLTDVIVEANEAKAALHWAVAQMEERYKALAARAERNITAYNSSAKVEPHERLPFIVVIIDELADLIMREGRKVEDPIVKIAQKARAVGIHLVLATQRPSVNVVTGLIKANVPSRIAFAMASNVDSRTVLDAPGAEDLIGRGDMLYQPADLPRPVRLQGVFVSDAEVHAVSDHWREQAPEPDYDPEVLAFSADDGGSGGQFGWLSSMAEDEMTARAAELIVTTGKASTSMLQTKLKVGFNRASRVIDELERYGIVGPQDPRNPAVPRQVYGPENWLRSKEAMDED
jgi:S-DNA-T family DNA segregation ATPase FtsK/SpoIIIE